MTAYDNATPNERDSVVSAYDGATPHRQAKSSNRLGARDPDLPRSRCAPPFRSVYQAGTDDRA